MKTLLLPLLLAAAIPSAGAAQHRSPARDVNNFLSALVNTPVVEAANRKGSTRVGGSGRSGKGGHYVGGRKR